MLPGARGELASAPGDDTSMILINFGRPEYKIGGITNGVIKMNGPMFNSAANTLPPASDWMHDSGKKYGHNHDAQHPAYGWTGGVDLNPDIYFDPQATTLDTDWRYECAVKFPKSKKYEVQVEKGLYQVEITYGSRATDSASDIKIEGVNPTPKDQQSLVTLAKDRYETRTYVEVEVNDGRMTFSLSSYGQAKTRIMYIKIVKGFQLFESQWEGSSLIAAPKWDGSQIVGWRRRVRFAAWSELPTSIMLSGSSNYDGDDNYRLYVICYSFLLTEYLLESNFFFCLRSSCVVSVVLT